MTRLEGLAPDGRRVPLTLEGSTLTSLCMQVAPDAPVFVVASLGSGFAADSLAEKLKGYGYKRVTVEVKEAWPQC